MREPRHCGTVTIYFLGVLAKVRFGSSLRQYIWDVINMRPNITTLLLGSPCRAWSRQNRRSCGASRLWRNEAQRLTVWTLAVRGRRRALRSWRIAWQRIVPTAYFTNARDRHAWLEERSNRPQAPTNQLAPQHRAGSAAYNRTMENMPRTSLCMRFPTRLSLPVALFCETVRSRWDTSS